MGAALTLPGKLVLLGAGRMGSAMLEGWLKAGAEGGKIAVIDPAPPEKTARLIAEAGAALNPAPETLADAAVFVAAVKPQMMDKALSGVAPALRAGHPLVISIAAGKPISAFKAHFGQAAPVIRAMPNTPAAIGRGITGFAASAEVTEAQKALARALLAALGEVVEVDSEEQIDAVTAVSGSGPAYVFLLAECLAKAGEAQGLAPELAEKLARATIAGAGELMIQSGEAAEALRRAVTSPGGTTAAALELLMDERGAGLCDLMTRAVAAAAARSRELAG